jgi:hypothetical protein
MSNSVAYALRAEHEDTFAGAVLCVGSLGESLDTAQALKEGKGVIVVPDTDTFAITALDQHPQFERVAVPEASAEPADRFDGLTVPELRTEAERLGVEKPGRSREEVLAAVREAQAAADADEDHDADGAPDNDSDDENGEA